MPSNSWMVLLELLLLANDTEELSRVMMEEMVVLLSVGRGKPLLLPALGKGGKGRCCLEQPGAVKTSAWFWLLDSCEESIVSTEVF